MKVIFSNNKNPSAITTERKLRLSASVTVESALLMPSVLLILLLFLYLMAHVHNRSVLASAACEQAISGKEREVEVLYLASGTERSVSETRHTRTVRYELVTVPLLSGRTWKETAEAEYSLTDPANVLHHLFALRELSED